MNDKEQDEHILALYNKQLIIRIAALESNLALSDKIIENLLSRNLWERITRKYE